MNPAKQHVAILLAAGSGRRMQGVVEDKLTALLNGVPVFIHSLRTFLTAKIVDAVVIVYRDANQKAELQHCLLATDCDALPIAWVMGGPERQDSVQNALHAITASDYVYIHDCARPLVDIDSLKAVRTAVETNTAAILAHPVVDTIKRIPAPNALQQIELEDLDRSRLWAMETPQAFPFDLIVKAYQEIHAKGIQVTDDAAAVAQIGIRATLVPNAQPNPKITSPADLAYAEWLLQKHRDFASN